ncbi:RasGEF domain-containing protein [Legionella lytica]|uniref:RasGEF domain-containing protein n=1 Tax=Legionella lytica TaxID=96232 RepID=A0ABW8DC66_9GAMM
MNEQTIKNLITSNENEKNIAKNLIKWFNQDSSLLDLRYLLDQNVFHFLIRKNKFQVLEKLLENEVWRSKATPCDRGGHTLLHYAAKCDASCLRVLELLMDYFPELLNQVDNAGNSPLHTAIFNKQSWAVRVLVKNPLVNRTLTNFKGESPMRLAAHDNGLNQALYCQELASIEQLDLRYRSPNSSTKEMLWKEFPLLSSASNPKLSSSRSRVANADIAEGHSEVSKEQLIFLVKDLVIAYKTNRNSKEAIQLQAQFNQFCMHHVLEIDFDQTDLDKKQVQMLLSKAMSFLHPAAHKHYSLVQHEFNCLLKLFAHLLINNQALAEIPPREELNLNTEKYQNKTIVQKLWLLTAGQEQPNSAREFDFSILSHRILGLLNVHSLIEILIGLRLIYLDCDLAQKSIANFLILQLLFYHATAQVYLPPQVGLQLRFLCNLNVNPRSELGEIGSEFNDYVEKAFQLSSMISSQPLLHNFYLIKQQVNHNNLVRTNDSFDELINQALALTPKKRVEHVELIAKELRTLTMAFYQRVSLNEFREECWLKEKRQQNASCITELTEQFNKLSVYFSDKILSQSAENLHNALLFFVELTQHLCPLDSEHYPDLNHLMMLSSVFNNMGVSRLTNTFHTLPSIERSIIDEVNRVVSNQKNFKFMRDIYNAYRTTLPFLGYILTEITFANAGNDNELIRAEMVGAVLKKLVEIKVQINFEQVSYGTTLPVFLAQYTPPDEEVLYQASLKLQAPKEEKSPRASSGGSLRNTLFHIKKGNGSCDDTEVNSIPKPNHG